MGGVIQQIDGIAYKMGEPFDFGFLAELGRVFRVFDDQDSGNICFGVEGQGRRLFVKFAGAPTARSTVTPAEAVANLRRTLPIYRDLAHDSLLPLLGAGEMGGGFALLLPWTEALCMGIMYPEAHARFMALSTGERLSVFRDIQSFLLHTARSGYTAVDFYDGSILYDFDQQKTLICDIDFFMKQPVINTEGRMWGSTRFMAPEEYEKGAVLDEITNVYTLGAFAFALFGRGSRDAADWELGRAAYDAACRATAPERQDRFGSIAAFMAAWSRAVEEEQ